MKQSRQKTAPDAFHTADRLHSLAIHLLRRVRKQDTAPGEGPARLSALSVLVFGGPIKPPTMTRIVSGPERGGLAQRIADSEDARRTSVRATLKGIQLLQAARQNAGL